MTQTPWLGSGLVRKVSAVNLPEGGVTLAAVTEDFRLKFNRQQGTGSAEWSGWRPDVGRDQVARVASVQHALGYPQTWTLDVQGRLQSGMPQAGTDPAPAPTLRAIASLQWNVVGDAKNPLYAKTQRVLGTVHVWAITDDFRLVGGPVGASGAGLDPENWNDAPPATAVTAMINADNEAQVWILDTHRHLWSSTFKRDGQLWTAWSGPAADGTDGATGWNGAPRLRAIAASQHRGAIASRNAASEGGLPDHLLLGITHDYGLIAATQRGKGRQWSPWSAPGWNGATDVKDAAAVQESDGSLQVWVVTTAGHLGMIRQTKRGGVWGTWQHWRNWDSPSDDPFRDPV